MIDAFLASLLLASFISLYGMVTGLINFNDNKESK